MPYTEEQFLEDYKRDVFRYDMLPHMTPEERMEGLKPEEVLANFKPEEIEKYLHSLKHQHNTN